MPKVNGKAILWARENARMTPVDACGRLGIKDGVKETAENKLTGYENSSKVPSRSMLKKMSGVYKVPLLTFYLDRPPNQPDRGEDFRTVPEDIKQDNAFFVDTLIRNIRSVQSTLKQVLIEQDEVVPVKLVNSLTMNDGVPAVADKIKSEINFDLDEFRNKPNHPGAFKYLRKLVEDAGVFVILKGNLGSHHSDIEVEAFRGFALADETVPFIVLNDKDAKSAWSFSIFHELAHLVLGKTGISAGANDNNIEKFCNQVASYILIPDLETIALQTNDAENIIEEISSYADKWNVSHSQLAYRLYLRGDYSIELWKYLGNHFRELWIDQRKKEKKKNKESDSGPSAYVLRRYRLGDALIKTVEGFIRSGAISTTKAGLLLETKPLKVDQLIVNSFNLEGNA